MTLGGYTSSEGVRGPIAETAEAVFTHQFTREQQLIARLIFLLLTELGDETATGDTRRRATFDELILKSEQAETTQVVLKSLADARLITTSEDFAEVAHEALIREWPTLREWLNQDREGLHLLRHLTEAAHEWELLGRDPGALYRGAHLAQAREWSESHPRDLNPGERAFIEASEEFEQGELRERAERQRRELEAARKLAESDKLRAEEQTHRARQLRRRAYYLAGVLLLALILAVAAYLQRNTANKQAHLAAARELALASIYNLDADAELSILLALQAVDKTYSVDATVLPEAEDALHEKDGAGSLSAEEREEYRRGRDELARALLAVQRLSLKPGETARQSLRVARALQVDLEWPKGQVRAVTLDLSVGGFAALMAKAPSQSDEVSCAFRLPGGDEMKAKARVASIQVQATSVRVAYAFQGMPEEHRERIERVVLDTVLDQLGR